MRFVLFVGLSLLVGLVYRLAYPTAIELLYDGDGELSVGQELLFLNWYNLTLPTFSVADGSENKFFVSGYAENNSSSISLCFIPPNLDSYQLTGVSARLQIVNDENEELLLIDQPLLDEQRFNGIAEGDYRKLQENGYERWMPGHRYGQEDALPRCFWVYQTPWMLDLTWSEDYVVSLTVLGLEDFQSDMNAYITINSGWK